MRARIIVAIPYAILSLFYLILPSIEIKFDWTDGRLFHGTIVELSQYLTISRAKIAPSAHMFMIRLPLRAAGYGIYFSSDKKIMSGQQ